MQDNNQQSSTSRLREEGEETVAHARQRAHDFVGEARAQSEQLVERARGQAEDAKRSVAEEIAKLAGALRRASDEFETDSLQHRTFHSAAAGVDTAADTVRAREFGELADEVTAFARRQPVAFLGGAALLGFAAARFANASERRREVERLEAEGGRAPRPGTGSGEPVSPTQPGPRQHTDPL